MMGSAIRWRPVPSDEEMPNVSKELWFALWHMRGVDTDRPDNMVLNRSDYTVLRAFHVAGIEGAEELIKAIEKHGAIVLEEHY